MSMHDSKAVSHHDERGGSGRENADRHLPLYQEAQGILDAKYTSGDNGGLWYDKFCFYWQINGHDWTLGKNKERWIKTVAGDNSCGQQEQLDEAISRYVALVRVYGGDVRIYSTQSRFVTGLGREHPVENGFTWHHTLGTPYLPGSSVKGVLRDWVEHWQDSNGDGGNKALVANLFGSAGSESKIGSLICFDALPVKPVKLEAEVMTPHYSEYYQDKGTHNPPADWYSPVPIPFLTVAASQKFIFGIAPRRGTAVDLAVVFQWLDQALEILGAGAKTASGYGSFLPVISFDIPTLPQAAQDIKQEQQTEQELANLSPIRREMEIDDYSSDQDKFMVQLTGKWLGKMEETAVPEAERREIAQLLMGWYKKNRPEQWDKPRNEKNRKKVERIKAALLVD